MKMKIILFSGHAGSGKDTAAGVIKDILHSSGYSVLTVHYADLLKFTLREFMGWDGEKDPRGRQLLQTIGTDVVRAADENYWVNYIVFMLKHLPLLYDYVLIPDARFPNEIDAVKNAFPNANVKHARVIRRQIEEQPDDGWRAHESETALDSYPHDIVIRNDGDLNDLRSTCRAVLWEYYDEEV